MEESTSLIYDFRFWVAVVCLAMLTRLILTSYP